MESTYMIENKKVPRRISNYEQHEDVKLSNILEQA